MKRLTRDIQMTLIIKFTLLIVLWVFCFKGAEKNKVSMQQWLYGSGTSTLNTKASVTEMPNF